MPASIDVFATTFRSAATDPRFAERSVVLPVPEYLDQLPRRPFSLGPELRLFFTVLRAGLRFRKLVLFSSRGYLKPELVATSLFRLLPPARRPVIVMYGEMYQKHDGWRGRLQEIVVSMASANVSKFVLFSDAEREHFCRTWGIPWEVTSTCRAFLPPTVVDGEDDPGALKEPLKAGTHRYIFSGGSAFRNFGPLVEAARLTPTVDYVICAKRSELPDALPPNVQVRSLEQLEYRYLLKHAAAVVVPLATKTSRVAGMFTYLRAMQLEKPTIISDALAVREYVNDGTDALVVEPEPEAYARAVEWVLDPANADQVSDMCRHARLHVEENYTLEPYVSNLLRIIDDSGPIVQRRSSVDRPENSQLSS